MSDCTCHPSERPRYCAGKYALSACLRSALTAADYAADYFAASFFAEQQKLIKSESDRAFIQSQYDKLTEWQTRHATEAATARK